MLRWLIPRAFSIGMAVALEVASAIICNPHPIIRIDPVSLPSYCKAAPLALILFATLTLGACAARPSWHWEKPGASDAAYEFDLKQCKARTYAGSSGAVTNETVRRMFACMEGKGWRKVEN